MTSEHDSRDSRNRAVSVEVFDRGRASTSSGVVLSTKSDKDRKIGHRRVDPTGRVTYKKRPTSELMAAIQLGISQSVGSLAPKPMRDVLYQDFHMVKTVFFPREGSNLTPGHKGSDFKFKTYAPVAFRYFRELFKIRPEDFLLSLCNEPLRELSNPGASGSIFYITIDDEFIIKTVQHQEADFLQELLPGYYMNLNQNPCTLLPKFYGLYCYESGGKNIRFVVMNNLLPSSIRLHEKYDLKGSTYKRKASKLEKLKAAPTLKDLDFRDAHPEGITLVPDTYAALVRTIDRDCRVLESFKIMDYSLLVGIQNLSRPDSQGDDDDDSEVLVDSSTVVAPSRPANRPRLAQYSTTMEAIQGYADVPLYSSSVIPGGIPANNSEGEQLLLYIGIIDILQSYHFAKKFEHALKSLIQDGDTISVHHPTFYAQRFKNFFAQTVFRNKQTQSKRKSVPSRRSLGMSENIQNFFSSANGRSDLGTVDGRRPGLLPQSTRKPDVLTSSTAPASAEVHQFEAVGSSTLAAESNSRNAVSILPSSLLEWNRSEEYPVSLPHLDRASSSYSMAVSTPTEASRADTTLSYTTSSVSTIGTSNPATNDDFDSHARYSVTIEQLSEHLASDNEETCL